MLWSGLNRAVKYLYSLESRLDSEILALCCAGLFTLIFLIRLLIDSRRQGFTLSRSLSRSFLQSAWIFPLVYCLILQVPLWITLTLSLGLGVGGKLIDSYLKSGQPTRQARKPAV